MRFPFLASTMLALAACSGSESIEQSENAIDVFHQQLNQGAFDTIYATASPKFRAVATGPDFTKFMTAVHTKLGAYEHGKNEGWRVNYNTSGNNVVVQYKSHFTKGDAVETFTFDMGKPKPKMIGYNINSPTLITG
ncbi:hypothetical protein [Sphingomonas sp.]|uniref:hypothetical protein n=1 Tax=Sphingomonas sp. TaxID=28214 RepID=UPI00286AA1F3|nr:hypothetical protein [Sphingomonas sp.]